jgi:hypothetical protein
MTHLPAWNRTPAGRIGGAVFAVCGDGRTRRYRPRRPRDLYRWRLRDTAALAAISALTSVAAFPAPLAEARDLVDLLDAVGRHDQVARLRLERFLRARGFEAEADRVA